MVYVHKAAPGETNPVNAVLETNGYVNSYWLNRSGFALQLDKLRRLASKRADLHAIHIHVVNDHGVVSSTAWWYLKSDVVELRRKGVV